MSKNWTDNVGSQHWPECRPAGLTSEVDAGLNVGKPDQKMSAADVGLLSDNVGLRRQPPTSTILSVMQPPVSLVIIRNFSLYVAVHFNSPLCNLPSLIASYPFAPTHH